MEVSDVALDETPKSFADYEPILLNRESLRKITTLLFRVDPESISGSELSNRLQEDKPHVRQKYSLPSEEVLRHTPEEYYRKLENIAHQEGVTVAGKMDYGRFFQERLANAVSLGEEKTIAMDRLQDNDSKQEVVSKGVTFQHELIHQMQNKRYPRMSLVRKEYEAYIAGSNEKTLIKNPWFFLERMAMSITRDQLKEEWDRYESEALKR